jgi:HAD superfamily hydrolase (TIGR01549 family)
MAKIEGIFFDLDDTLILCEPAMEAAHAVCATHLDVPASAITGAINAVYADEFDFGCPYYHDLKTLSSGELRRILTKKAFVRLGIAADVEAIVTLYEAEEALRIAAFADTHTVLTELKTRFPLGIITNGPSRMQREKIERLDLAPYFHPIVVDTEVGYSKPDPIIFAHAAHAMDILPENLLFVGNSLTADIVGANGAGWTSVWVNTYGADCGEHVPHHEIRVLSDLWRVIEEIGQNVA